MIAAVFVTDLATVLIGFDRQAFHWINGRLASEPLDFIMPLVTDLGLGHVQVAALLVAAFWAGSRDQRIRSLAFPRRIAGCLQRARCWLCPALLAMALTGTTVQALKRIERKRPSWFYVHEHRSGRNLDVEVHTIHGRRPLRVNGFPSGHTATTAALAVTLGMVHPFARSRRRAAAALSVMTALIGVSRIYMADHWPLDVLGGAAMGVLCGWIVVQLIGRVPWLTRLCAPSPLGEAQESGT